MRNESKKIRFYTQEMETVDGKGSSAAEADPVLEFFSHRPEMCFSPCITRLRHFRDNATAPTAKPTGASQDISDGSPSLPVSAADKRLQENKIHLDDNKDIRSLIHQLAWDCAFAGFERASQVVHLAVKP